MTPDVSVEFFHIYADNVATREFASWGPALAATRDALEALKRAGKSYSLNVLIDNYFSPSSEVDAEPLYEFLTSEGLRPDGIYLEGDLHRVCTDFIDEMRPAYYRRTPDALVSSMHSEDAHLVHDMPDESLKGMFLRSAGGVAKWRERGPGPRDIGSVVAGGRVERSSTVVLARYDESGEIRYSCPLLAACWVLARLGVDPFRQAVRPLIRSPDSLGFVGAEVLNILPTMYLSVEATVYELLRSLKRPPLRRLRHSMQYSFYRI